MEDDKELRVAELARLEAERRKLELEAKEIERRITTPWWQGPRFGQYVLATVITAALLFGWTRAYIEPIISKDNEIAKKQNTLIELEKEKIEHERDLIRRENEKLSSQRNLIEQENIRLSKRERELKDERDRLQEETEILNEAIAGMKFAVELVAEGEDPQFSLVNSSDQINALRNYDWSVSSDDYFNELGYYLVINHEGVRDGKDIIVTRQSNVDALKREFPDNWRSLMREKTSYRYKKAPVLALDYSYFGLFAEGQAPVGGTIYEHDGEETKFYAPLGSWKEKLNELLDW